MKTKVDIFSGFLGAGKTMLIKKLISEKLYNENIIIIENEFGEVGIDGSILKRENIEVKEINAGCICCSVSGDFKKAVEEVIIKYNPSRIIIEPSGVGKLSDIIKALKTSDVKNKININLIITVVDVLKYETYIVNFSEFYKDQILNGNTIILSRTQNSTPEKLEKVVTAIKNINKKANIITTPWDKLSAEKIMEVGEHDAQVDLNEKVNLLKKPINISAIKLQTNATSNSAKDVFTTWGIETPKRYSESTLKDIFNILKNKELYGVVLRAKGIVQLKNDTWVQFDYVPDEFQIKNTTPDYTGRICVIGSKLNIHNLQNLF